MSNAHDDDEDMEDGAKGTTEPKPYDGAVGNHDSINLKNYR